MSIAWTRLAFVSLALTAGLPATYGGPIHDENYVYTNADLEALPPIPSGSPTVPRPQDAAAWRFVTTFLADERAKLDADRDHELERRRVEIERRRSIGYATPYPAFLIAPYGRDFRSRVVHVPHTDDMPATNVPHPMFRERPPVREFVPGLGDSYRGLPPGGRH
jgi:hypothetical protein